MLLDSSSSWFKLLRIVINATHFQEYKLRYHQMSRERQLPLEKWLGKQLGKLTLFNCAGSILDSVIDKLKDFEFRNLEMSMSSLSKKDL